MYLVWDFRSSENRVKIHFFRKMYVFRGACHMKQQGVNIDKRAISEALPLLIEEVFDRFQSIPNDFIKIKEPSILTEGRVMRDWKLRPCQYFFP